MWDRHLRAVFGGRRREKREEVVGGWENARHEKIRHSSFK
jgi:hypothetical protein